MDLPTALLSGTGSNVVSFSLRVSRRQEMRGSYTKASSMAITLSLLSRSTLITFRNSQGWVGEGGREGGGNV